MAQLVSLGDDAEGIQQFNVLVFGTPLWDEQLKIALKATKPVNQISPGNGFGKSELIVREAARWCFRKLERGRFPIRTPSDNWLQDWLSIDYRALVASYQFDLAREIFQRLLRKYEEGGLLTSLITRVIHSDPPKIVFINGSILDFGSLDHGGKHVEGTRRQVIWVDEVGHMSEFKRLFADVLNPRTLGVNGTIFLLGTPKEQTDPWLYEIAELGRTGHSRYSFFEGSSFDNPYWPKEDRDRVLEDPLLAHSHIIELMKRRGANIYDGNELMKYGALTDRGRQVILGHFILAGGLFFNRFNVARMFSGEHDWYIPKPGVSVTAWDLGGNKKGGDATVGVTLDLSELPWRVTRLEHIPAGDADWNDKYNLIERVQKEDRSVVVGVDVTGASSDAVAERLEERALPIERIHFGGNLGTKKYDMLRGLQSAMDVSWEGEDPETGKKIVGKGKIRFPSPNRYPELEPRAAEFYRYKLDDTKLVTDTVIATAMAEKLAEDYAMPGAYEGSIWALAHSMRPTGRSSRSRRR